MIPVSIASLVLPKSHDKNDGAIKCFDIMQSNKKSHSFGVAFLYRKKNKFLFLYNSLCLITYSDDVDSTFQSRQV